ncbi:MAG: hypothetical protein HY887_06635 [Deltaproteobacteria bacterium]|nr:hypothetical protein [Deltaproteobacteria bacterium]
MTVQLHVNKDIDMRELNAQACASGNDDVAHSAVADAKAKEAVSLSGWLLAILVAAAAILGAYESLTEKYLPADSILSSLHALGYMRRFPVVYEPSKGIWLFFGWAGTAMMAVMMVYSMRKRLWVFREAGSMRGWLSGHMFLGIMGPLLITFHSTFKFRGLIATSFWCMMVTMIFGVLGRYIYGQIPRGITGAELDINMIDKEIDCLDKRLGGYLSGTNIDGLLKKINGSADGAEGRGLFGALFFMARTDLKNLFAGCGLEAALAAYPRLSAEARKEIARLLRKKAAIARRRNFLATSHRLLHNWHVFHIPLAAVMFIIMSLHIAVYFIFSPGF